MRRRSMGLGLPLILPGAAAAEFLGIQVVDKPNEAGLLVCNVYALFDRPGEDHMTAVAGTPDSPLDVFVIDGTFFQHQFGTDRPPNPALFGQAPTLRHDTFVTIGVKSYNPNDPGNPEGAPQDNMLFTPTWPGFQPETLQLTNDGWAVTPVDAQGDPFDPDFPAGGEGAVLIAQFSTADGTGVAGTMVLGVESNGVWVVEPVSFAMLPACPWDLNHDAVVNGLDLGELRARFGPCPNQPYCPGDFDGDGEVGILDFLALVAHFGVCPDFECPPRREPAFGFLPCP